MKTELEEIQPHQDSSFSLMVNPNLSDFFFWHFHPEYELIFIDGADGNRHVGKHLSKFKGSDMVLIGSYIPHLNFDYGVKSRYEKMVVHLRANFLQDNLQGMPELYAVRDLLIQSQHGIAFGEATKQLIGPRLKALPSLQYFKQFLELLDILHYLYLAEDKVLLHPKPVKNQFTRKDQDRLKHIYEFVENHFRQKIDIAEVAEMSHLSNAAFCRYFKKMTKLTFTEFVNHYRIDKAKKMLLQNKNVTEACFDCGFESLSYFNRTFKKVTGKNPTSFKKDYLG